MGTDEPSDRENVDAFSIGDIGRKPKTRRQLMAGGGAVGLGMLLAACGGDDDDGGGGGSSGGGSGASKSLEGTELTFLAWPGHGDQFLVGPFQEETGIRVRVKEYQDGEEALALYSQSDPGTYDVIMTEPTDLQRFVAATGFEALDPAEFPAAQNEFIEMYQTENEEWKDILGGWFDGEWVAVPWSWAIQSMSINDEKVPEEDRGSYAFVWEPEYKDRIGWSIYWLNAMSTMSQYYGMTQGWWEPYEITPLQLTDAQWTEFRDWMFSTGTDNIRGFYGIGDGTQAFAQGEIWAYPGAGFPTTATLQFEGRPFSSQIPKEGSPMYSESLSIGRGSKNLEGAKEFIKYCISAEGCAKKALLPAYQGLPVNFESWKWIAENEPDWVDVMQIDPNGPNVLDHWEKGILSPRILPEDVDLWVQTYEEFKNTVG